MVFDCLAFAHLRNSPQFRPIFDRAHNSLHTFFADADVPAVGKFISHCMRCIDQLYNSAEQP